MQNLSIKILKKFVFLSIGVFIFIGGISYFWIKELYIEQIKKDLIHDVEIITLEIQNIADFSTFAKKFKALTSIRLTIIDKDGNVIAESDANVTQMDNHKSRPEIFEASFKDFGESIRESKTLHQELLYVAKKIQIDGKDYFIRVASRFDEVYSNFISFTIKVTIIFAFFLGAFIYITYKISDEIRYETDKIVSFLKSLKDQTVAKEIHSTYSQEFADITNHLSEVSKALVKKNKKKSKYTAKLKLANKQKDEILSAISHEFKNPISVISGYSQTLVEDPDINAKIRNKFLHKIYTSAMRLTGMIDRLRLFIKLEEDKQPVKYIQTDIKKLVESVVEDLQTTYPNREILLELEEVSLAVDEPLFRVAIANIIENSLKYSEDEVIVILTKEMLQVIDKGIGIDEKDIEKVTQKFYRVSANGWDNSLGIGLSLVNHIINVHKMKLEIQSKRLVGSTFSIKF